MTTDQPIAHLSISAIHSKFSCLWVCYRNLWVHPGGCQYIQKSISISMEHQDIHRDLMMSGELYSHQEVLETASTGRVEELTTTLYRYYLFKIGHSGTCFGPDLCSHCSVLIGHCLYVHIYAISVLQ